MRTIAGVTAAVCLHACAFGVADEFGLLFPIAIVLGVLGLYLVCSALRNEDTAPPYPSEPEFEPDRLGAPA
jgi:hypothetical protein